MQINEGFGNQASHIKLGRILRRGTNFCRLDDKTEYYLPAKTSLKEVGGTKHHFMASKSPPCFALRWTSGKWPSNDPAPD
ncbi:MAG: hypothetical protein A3C71_00105 [Candidatus Yanofskybacteria bacterium RIFCSPHIGHO2_02_FULL_43_15c]|uniref:Uncharacterized protein n=1 Tax=Candidatus Yanofskybacteria bacterium RIFCSPHIGHO2_02_FULL_43_15c TaxID=1802679 RepID=A0A1F8FH43_9BACT|nr:MAG: hypothetical protein A3C71_00105 [Candidatus Yanofskybacteria bacterium RIFCSPHIGHO2_02_FULL_43_15c]